ncbi:uncharacterized protein LOC100900705 [Galendromus occidentalis]|uniref:Uncharacterized protein LOC100900705 n=1 Tax=Galendromus occidentalis TaxID=34638 RepID=A0AAJ6QXR5_9ACAR|nr:uncharacterized protein LOC100900705 [Galendromus occidentalis]
MKIFFAVALTILVCEVSADTASGDHTSDDSKFGKWRSCLASKLPADKQKVHEDCFKKPGGTDMSKFRRGLSCVLDSYGVVKDHKIDQAKMASTATSITSPELKKAFTECPKDDKNVSEDRTIKCVIDNLETTCKLST